MPSLLSHTHTFRCSRPGPALIHLASQPTVTGTVNTDRIHFHGCCLRTARLNDNSRRPHPVRVAAAPYHPHTSPPDVHAPLVYQRPLSNTYRTSDLCRPRQRARPPSLSGDRRAFAITSRGAGVDLPGFGRRRRDMPESDQEDGASTDRNAYGGSRPRAGRVPVRDDERGKRQWRRSEFPSADDPAWARCTVKSHEDFPRHIYRLFLLNSDANTPYPNNIAMLQVSILSVSVSIFVSVRLNCQLVSVSFFSFSFSGITASIPSCRYVSLSVSKLRSLERGGVSELSQAQVDR
jgi:hypothetical protein